MPVPDSSSFPPRSEGNIFQENILNVLSKGGYMPISTSKRAQASACSTTKTVYKWQWNVWSNHPACVIKCQQLSGLKNMPPPKRKAAERGVCSLHPHITYTLLEHPQNSPNHFYHCLSIASLHSLVSQTISSPSVDKLPSDKMHTDKISRSPQVVISSLFFSWDE